MLNLERHRDANTNYFEQGVHILELAQKDYSLHLWQTVAQKGRLLNFLLSNCTLDYGNLYPTYKKPFDLLAKGYSRSDWFCEQNSSQRQFDSHPLRYAACYRHSIGHASPRLITPTVSVTARQSPNSQLQPYYVTTVVGYRAPIRPARPEEEL